MREAIAVDCDVVLVPPTMGLPTTSSGKLSRSRAKANYLAGLYDRPRPPRPKSSAVTKLVAVTGATGFVGPHLVAALARRGFKLRLLVRRWSPLPSLAGVDADMVLGDLSDEAALSAWSTAPTPSSMPPA